MTAPSSIEQFAILSPGLTMEQLIGFNIADGLFTRLDRATYVPDPSVGSNAIPCIQVKNMTSHYERVGTVALGAVLTAGIVVEGAFNTFRIADFDGNVVAFFEIDSDSAGPLSP